MSVPRPPVRSAPRTRRGRLAPMRVRRGALPGVLLLQMTLWVTSSIAAPHAPAGQAVSTTTGTIVGTVRDSTGAVLPGVTIVASGPSLMSTREATTDEGGSYRLVALPPGGYTLVFRLEDFRVARVGVHVGLGFTAAVDVVLDIAGVQEHAVVSRSAPAIDAHATGVAVRFSPRELSSLPISRTMWALQDLTPGVHMFRADVGGSAAATPGGTTAYGTTGLNRPTVEGVSITGINSTGMTLDYGSFEEVAVRTAGHGPEWHSPGVHTEFISKSGGNQYRGTLYGDYEHRRWQWFNIDEDQVGRGARGGPDLGPRETNRLWRYHDVNADLGGYVVKDRLWWYSSVRHQEVAARQVNFPVKALETSLINSTGKTTYQVSRSNSLIAFAQIGRNHQPNRLTPFTPRGFGGGPAAAIHESEDATAEQRALGWIGKVEWNSTVRDRLFLEARAAQFGSRRPERPYGTAPRVEDVATLQVSGGNRDWQHDFRRSQALGSISYFRRGRFGVHHLKAGGEIFETVETEQWKHGYPGDVLHVQRNGDPIEVYLFETPSSSTSGLWTYSVYAGDSWTVSSRLTLNLGLRFDRYRIFLPRQEHPAGRFNPTPQTFPARDGVIAWSVVVPRIGAIYQLTADGRTVAKVGYGRYRLAPGTVLGSNANPNASQWWRRYEWRDANGSGIWEPGEEGREVERRGGAAVESLDPNLKLPVLDEVTGWLERELPGTVAFRVGVVWRSTRQPWLRQNASQPFDAFSVPVLIPDPGPDMVAGTPDDGAPLRGYNLRDEFLKLPQASVVKNVPGADSWYWTWDVAATRRFAGRWSLTAGLAHTWNRDQAAAYAGQAVRNNAYPATSNDLINAGSKGQHEFTTWTARAHGTYHAPKGFHITPVVRHQSGQPFGRTLLTPLNYGSVRVLAEPVGTRRTDHVTIVDLRVEKDFRAAGPRISAFVDLFNLFNTNAELNVNWSSGPSFLRPLAIVPPRIARLGARVEW